MPFKTLMTQLMNEADDDGAASGGGLDDPTTAVFESIAGELLDEGDEDVSDVGGEETPAVVDTPAATDAKPASVVTPAVETPAPVPAATPTPAPAQTPAPSTTESNQTQEPSPSPAPAPVQVTREESVGKIAEMLAIKSEDDIELLRTEPEKVLPKLMAGLFYDMHATIMRQVQEQMPQYIQHHDTRAVQVKQAADEFYQAWPALKEHSAIVNVVAKVYKGLNGNVDRATAIKEIGAMAMIKAKIPFDWESGAATPPAAVAPAPKPVAPGGIGGSGSPAAQPNNPFELLAEELLIDDSVE
jgi:hypothetical protein